MFEWQHRFHADWTVFPGDNMKKRICKDCGRRLDAFGICPNANPAEAAIMVAPVHCGGTFLFKLDAMAVVLERITNGLPALAELPAGHLMPQMAPAASSQPQAIEKEPSFSIPR